MTPRAERFPLIRPIQYRVAGEQWWGRGVTENMSATGVLFRSARPIHIGTDVDVDVVMQEGLPGRHILCRARIVRASAPLEASAEWLLAASMEMHA